MGQQEVLKILKRENGWVNSVELRNLVEDGKTTVTSKCNSLVKSGDVERKKIRIKNHFCYAWRYNK